MDWRGGRPSATVAGARRRRGPSRRPRRAAYLACLVLLLGACSLALPGLPGAPAARIAYVTPDGLIATITPGGQPAIVTPPAPGDASDPGRRRYNWPTWSPDGQRLAFIAIDGIGNSGAVLVAEPTGANQVIIEELPRGYPIYLSWSPDGARIAMLTAGEDTLNLLIGNADGRGQARKLTAGQPLFSSWSPDGRALVVHANGTFFAPTLGRLSIVPTDAGAPLEPIDLDPEPFRAPAWSPAGSHQALAGDNGIGEPGLFLRARDGSLRRFADLTGPPAIIWSPAGDRLAWASLDGPPFAYNGLNVATPDGRTRLRLTDARHFAFFWSPDGEQIAYMTLDDSERLLVLHVIPSRGGEARTVASFQPSREFIQLVSYFDQYAQSVSIWSPDSRTLLYAGWPPEADTETPAVLFTVAADGSAPAQALTPGRIGFYAPPPRQRR
jgi:TolB protein